MKRIRRVAVVLLTLLTSLAVVPAAFAHPLGNFTINHYAGIRVSRDKIAVDFVLDMAEIPAFQEIAAFEQDFAEGITAIERRMGTLYVANVKGLPVEKMAEGILGYIKHPPMMGAEKNGTVHKSFRNFTERILLLILSRTGVDFISVGRLTHSAPAADINHHRTHLAFRLV